MVLVRTPLGGIDDPLYGRQMVTPPFAAVSMVLCGEMAKLYNHMFKLLLDLLIIFRTVENFTN